jgi:hypothetical protein
VPTLEKRSHHVCVAYGDSSFWEESRELLMNPTMCVAGDGFAEGEGFEGDAAESLGVGRAGDDDIGDRHDLTQVVAMADEGDVVF